MSASRNVVSFLGRPVEEVAQPTIPGQVSATSSLIPLSNKPPSPPKPSYAARIRELKASIPGFSIFVQENVLKFSSLTAHDKAKKLVDLWDRLTVVQQKKYDTFKNVNSIGPQQVQQQQQQQTQVQQPPQVSKQVSQQPQQVSQQPQQPSQPVPSSARPQTQVLQPPQQGSHVSQNIGSQVQNQQKITASALPQATARVTTVAATTTAPVTATTATNQQHTKPQQQQQQHPQQQQQNNRNLPTVNVFDPGLAKKSDNTKVTTHQQTGAIKNNIDKEHSNQPHQLQRNNQNSQNNQNATGTAAATTATITATAVTTTTTAVTNQPNPPSFPYQDADDAALFDQLNTRLIPPTSSSSSSSSSLPLLPPAPVPAPIKHPLQNDSFLSSVAPPSPILPPPPGTGMRSSIFPQAHQHQPGTHQHGTHQHHSNAITSSRFNNPNAQHQQQLPQHQHQQQHHQQQQQQPYFPQMLPPPPPFNHNPQQQQQQQQQHQAGNTNTGNTKNIGNNGITENNTASAVVSVSYLQSYDNKTEIPALNSPTAPSQLSKAAAAAVKSYQKPQQSQQPASQQQQHPSQQPQQPQQPQTSLPVLTIPQNPSSSFPSTATTVAPPPQPTTTTATTATTTTTSVPSPPGTDTATTTTTTATTAANTTTASATTGHTSSNSHNPLHLDPLPLDDITNDPITMRLNALKRKYKEIPEIGQVTTENNNNNNNTNTNMQVPPVSSSTASYYRQQVPSRLSTSPRTRESSAPHSTAATSTVFGYPPQDNNSHNSHNSHRISTNNGVYSSYHDGFYIPASLCDIDLDKTHIKPTRASRTNSPNSGTTDNANKTYFNNEYTRKTTTQTTSTSSPVIRSNYYKPSTHSSNHSTYQNYNDPNQGLVQQVVDEIRRQQQQQQQQQQLHTSPLPDQRSGNFGLEDMYHRNNDVLSSLTFPTVPPIPPSMSSTANVPLPFQQYIPQPPPPQQPQQNAAAVAAAVTTNAYVSQQQLQLYYIKCKELLNENESLQIKLTDQHKELTTLNDTNTKITSKYTRQRNAASLLQQISGVQVLCDKKSSNHFRLTLFNVSLQRRIVFDLFDETHLQQPQHQFHNLESLDYSIIGQQNGQNAQKHQHQQQNDINQYNSSIHDIHNNVNDMINNSPTHIYRYDPIRSELPYSIQLPAHLQTQHLVRGDQLPLIYITLASAVHTKNPIFVTEEQLYETFALGYKFGLEHAVSTDSNNAYMIRSNEDIVSSTKPYTISPNSNLLRSSQRQQQQNQQNQQFQHPIQQRQQQQQQQQRNIYDNTMYNTQDNVPYGFSGAFTDINQPITGYFQQNSEIHENGKLTHERGSQLSSMHHSPSLQRYDPLQRFSSSLPTTINEKTNGNQGNRGDNGGNSRQYVNNTNNNNNIWNTTEDMSKYNYNNREYLPKYDYYYLGDVQVPQNVENGQNNNNNNDIINPSYMINTPHILKESRINHDINTENVSKYPISSTSNRNKNKQSNVSNIIDNNTNTRNNDIHDTYQYTFKDSLSYFDINTLNTNDLHDNKGNHDNGDDDDDGDDDNDSDSDVVDESIPIYASTTQRNNTSGNLFFSQPSPPPTRQLTKRRRIQQQSNNNDLFSMNMPFPTTLF